MIDFFEYLKSAPKRYHERIGRLSLNRNHNNVFLHLKVKNIQTHIRIFSAYRHQRGWTFNGPDNRKILDMLDEDVERTNWDEIDNYFVTTAKNIINFIDSYQIYCPDIVKSCSHDIIPPLSVNQLLYMIKYDDRQSIGEMIIRSKSVEYCFKKHPSIDSPMIVVVTSDKKINSISYYHYGDIFEPQIPDTTSWTNQDWLLWSMVNEIPN